MNNLLQALLTSKSVPSDTLEYLRGDLLTNAGEVENYIYIIINGAVRVTYFEEGDKEEQTIRFGYKNSILTSVPSFFDNSPSLFSIECIRKSTIKRIHKVDFYNLIMKNDDFRNEYDLFLQSFFKQQIDREIDLLTTSPQKRLQRVLKRSPQLFQEIPLKYIASYLRMQPETLSRILKQNN